MLDFYSYKNLSINNIFFYKFYSLQFFNFSNIDLSLIKFFFELKNLEHIDDLRVSNYFYFFRFFFGKKAFIFNYFSEFDFGSTYFNLNVECVFKGSEMYYAFFFLSNDYFSIRKKRSYDLFELNNNSFLLNLNDMNIFMEKKTTSGLFYLKNALSFKIIFSGMISYQRGQIYLTSFKIF